MKFLATMALCALPLAAFGQGWNYYVLNDQGKWESVSPYDIDLAFPKGSDPTRSSDGLVDAQGRRVMILYNQPPPKNRQKGIQWIRQVGSDLAEVVK